MRSWPPSCRPSGCRPRPTRGCSYWTLRASSRLPTSPPLRPPARSASCAPYLTSFTKIAEERHSIGQRPSGRARADYSQPSAIAQSTRRRAPSARSSAVMVSAGTFLPAASRLGYFRRYAFIATEVPQEVSMPGSNPATVHRFAPGSFARVSSMVVGGGRLFLLLAAVMLPGFAQAQVTPIENFESYADSATMRARWVPVSPLPGSSVTLDPTGIDGKSLRLAYDVKAGSNAVEFTFV